MPPLSTILEGLAGAATVGFTVLFSPLLRPWYRKWGATPAEAASTFPGDEYVPHPRSEITGAITVKAPVRHVWPWFVQLGCGRGGWYSYDLLDNGGKPSADRVIPEFQNTKVGDKIAAVPNGAFGFPVAEIQPERALVLGGTLDVTTGKDADPNDPNLKAYFSGDQTFYMLPIDGNTTRLMFRMRTGWNPTGMNNFIYRAFLEPVSFVMGRQMLKSIKRRAEKLAAQG